MTRVEPGSKIIAVVLQQQSGRRQGSDLQCWTWDWMRMECQWYPPSVAGPTAGSKHSQPRSGACTLHLMQCVALAFELCAAFAQLTAVLWSYLDRHVYLKAVLSCPETKSCVPLCPHRAEDFAADSEVAERFIAAERRRRWESWQAAEQQLAVTTIR